MLTIDKLRDSIDKKAQNVVQLLVRNSKKIATAESCTGGLVSAAITAVSGSSEIFDAGICTYANAAKMKYLGVNEETLKTHGAVSPETALQMAAGIREATGSDIGISVTGIAGPTGGTEQKPVGTVYVGLCDESGCEARLVFTETENVQEDKKREYIRLSTVLAALSWAEERIGN